ncbi:3-hydroxyacyl-CoA dehydrogenase [Aromatoleum diolicum]|uniref:3-hydroxyacyl-CoA dehydrogenase n=1 Tax=Aromatoleum diolicum TaxID=75796 RepID=A0ABX1QBJ4_9RHOO|nr:3-hydroxyacyl-CoA dehydrogenase [Aromatoleum diolicum]NMG75744.1 3-hydroxyacyl-CoA dehydrogenase [Aromatoleum diolicum]
MLDTTRNDLQLGVVGTGLMGRGIAQIAVQGGIRVLLHDARPEAAGEARDAIAQTLATLAAKGKIASADAVAATARLATADALEGLADCDVVVEAIVEQLEAKRELFRRLEDIVGATCILATNTSSLSVTAIAAGCRLPGRVAGFHFFSPVPLMKIVEVIDGALSEPWVGDALTALAQRTGHTPVRAQDTPGFVVNHAGRGYGTEALRILGEGITDFAAIDRILRESAGFRMGPFELLDLTGLDVSHPVMESIYDQYYQEPRFRPSPITRQRLAAGLLGRKSGRGFYTYREGKAEVPPAEAPPPATGAPVWLSRRNAAAAERVAALLEHLGATLDRGERPGADAVCLVLPIGEDATTAALAEGLDPARTLALDALALDGHRTLMRTPLTTRAMRDAAWGLLASDGTPVTVINDSPGFVAQRVLAMIVNIGCDIAQQGIATPSDIDRAVTLGLGYPKGPLTLGDALGAATVLEILDAMHTFYRDPRYRPSPWLIRRARLGVSLLTADH